MVDADTVKTAIKARMTTSGFNLDQGQAAVVVDAIVEEIVSANNAAITEYLTTLNAHVHAQLGVPGLDPSVGVPPLFPEVV